MVGLEPIDRLHGGISDELAVVATFPQLEYPRAWPASVHVTGPFGFELPYPDIELPEGDEPLVLVAASTAQDPDCRLIRVALEALADEPVRVLATTNGHFPPEPLPTPPPNARLVDWLSLLAGDCRGRSRRSATAAMAPSRGRSAPAFRSYASRPSATWPRRARGSPGQAPGVMLPWRLLSRVDAAAGDAKGAGRAVLCDARGRDRSLGGESRRGGAGGGAGRGPSAGLKLRGWDSNPQPIG